MISTDTYGACISTATRIADEQRIPFDVMVPNTTTREAIAELGAGKGRKFDNIEALMADLQPGD